MTEINPSTTDQPPRAQMPTAVRVLAEALVANLFASAGDELAVRAVLAEFGEGQSDAGRLEMTAAGLVLTFAESLPALVADPAPELEVAE